ncbi:MAG: hypothetical protein ABL962_13410 [Fimbriimonadaceae bacterium]
MENDANQPGNGVAPDDALERIKALEREAAALRAQLGAAPKPEEPAPEVKAVEPSSEEVKLGLMAKARLEAAALPKPSDEDIENAERLCQRFQLELKRGNKEFAGKYLEEAIGIAPGSSAVVECRADFAAFDRKNLEAAHLYRIAIVLDSTNKAADAKLADLVFRSQAKASSIVAEMGETTANAKIATVLTAMVPGLGQLVSGSIIPGAIILVLWMGCLIFIPSGLTSLVALVSGRGTVNVASLIPLGFSFILWLGAVLHMNSKSKHKVTWEGVMGAEAPKKGPVKPPVDLPYE